MHQQHQLNQGLNIFETYMMITLLLFVIFIYVVAVWRSNGKFRRWPNYRTICWIVGIGCIGISLAGPLANQAHTNFQAHMITHLLLGMLGPLLLALAAPISLILKTLPIYYARKLSRVLKSKYIRFITHPVISTIFNIGGLWLLYTTSLFSAMHTSAFLYFLIHLHVFLAGFIFTISMIYIDPAPHRRSFRLRAVVLIVAMAGHSILSKWIYNNPPVGVGKADAQSGGIIMYYGGDAIELIIVIALCYQYFRLKPPHVSDAASLNSFGEIRNTRSTIKTPLSR